MSVHDLSPPLSLQLVPFEPDYAPAITQWVRTDQELRWLAPSTKRPLTKEKIVRWKKPGGSAWLLVSNQDPQPLGYGELNPMQRKVNQLWLGHVIVRPGRRGRGTGRTFVQLLLRVAFERFLASRVLLIVFPDNTAAIRCYRRAGFQIAGEEHHRFRGGGPVNRLLRLEVRSTAVITDP